MNNKQLTSALLIRRLYRTCFIMWDERNKVLHDKTTIHALHGEREINYRLQVQLDLGDEDILPNDRHLIKVDADTMIKRPLQYKKEWLQTIEAARSCKMPTSKSPYNYSRRILRRFMNTSSSDATTRAHPTMETR